LEHNAIKVPDEVIEAARQYLGSEDDARWQLGDFLSDVVSELEPAYYGVGVKHPRAEMFRVISGAIGCDPSTLRDRQSMSEFYPYSVRASYSALTWSQLRACKSAGNLWREYADWSLSNLPAPVAVIRAKIKNGGDLPPVWCGRWQRIVELSDLLQSDAEAPPAVRLAARLISLGIYG
jgi:hypothetical protein